MVPRDLKLSKRKVEEDEEKKKKGRRKRRKEEEEEERGGRGGRKRRKRRKKEEEERGGGEGEEWVFKFQEVEVHPPSSTPIYFTSKNYIHGSRGYLQKWQNLTKNKLELHGHYGDCSN